AFTDTLTRNGPIGLSPATAQSPRNAFASAGATAAGAAAAGAACCADTTAGVTARTRARQGTTALKRGMSISPRPFDRQIVDGWSEYTQARTRVFSGTYFFR